MIGVPNYSEGIRANSVPAEAGEGEVKFDKNEITRIYNEVAKITRLDDLARGLERAMAYQGLHVLVERYGAERFIQVLSGQDKSEAAINEGLPRTVYQVMERLVYKENDSDRTKERVVDLVDEIQNEPLATVAKKFNETAGGVVTISDNLDTIEGARRLSGGEDMEDFKLESAFTYGAMNGQFYGLMADYPDIIERFKQSKNLFAFLKDIRDTHAAECAKLSLDIDRAKSIVESLVAEREALVDELQAIARAGYETEVTALEAKRDQATDEETKAMTQALIYEVTNRFAVEQGKFTQMKQAVRAEILASLKAEQLDQLQLNAMPVPRPINLPKEEAEG